MGKQWTDNEIEYLKKNYQSKTYKELSQILNRSKSAINLKMKQLGLKKSKYTYNHDYFESIDTSEKAYWLGFLYVYGCVTHENNECSGLSIKLQKRDINHLKKFNRAIQGNVECTIFRRKCNLNNKYYDGCQIKLYSEKMIHDLMKHGVQPKQSLKMQFPNIDNQLVSHFVRGFFDGDGCIHLHTPKRKSKSYIKADFTSDSLYFLKSLRVILYENGIQSYIADEKNKNNFRLVIGGIRNCDNFFNYIYKDATVYLDRKLNKKNMLYEYLNLEQRLLRQSERTG